MLFEKLSGRHTIYLETKSIGKDLLIAVFGGDDHHIGGVAVAYPTQSHYRDSLTISVNSITLPGHKDYVIANSSAEKMCKALSRPVVSTVGIHYDAATPKEIQEIIATVDSLIDEAISYYQNAE